MNAPIDLKSVMARLAIPAYRYYESIGSTNEAALKWLHEDAVDKALIVADHQSAGRGRQQRRWVTNPGSSIALSLILKLTPNEQSNVQLLSALAGLACQQVLETHYQLAAKIKWPNDVLIEGQKCAGILVEAAWQENGLVGVVIGIGVNLFPGSVPPSDQIRFPATYVQAHTRLYIDKYLFLENLLKSIFLWRTLFNSDNFYNQYQKTMAFRGETVYIYHNNGTHFSGTLLGIECNGDLRLADQDGIIHTFNAGEVHLRPATAEWEDRYA